MLSRKTRFVLFQSGIKFRLYMIKCESIKIEDRTINWFSVYRINRKRFFSRRFDLGTTTYDLSDFLNMELNLWGYKRFSIFYI